MLFGQEPDLYIWFEYRLKIVAVAKKSIFPTLMWIVTIQHEVGFAVLETLELVWHRDVYLKLH